MEINGCKLLHSLEYRRHALHHHNYKKYKLRVYTGTYFDMRSIGYDWSQVEKRSEAALVVAATELTLLCSVRPRCASMFTQVLPRLECIRIRFF